MSPAGPVMELDRGKGEAKESQRLEVDQHYATQHTGGAFENSNLLGRHAARVASSNGAMVQEHVLNNGQLILTDPRELR